MNIIQKYIDYLKDNPHKYWFKRKLFGWGWTPARWQGWIVTIGVVAAVVLNVVRLEPRLNQGEAVPELFIETAALVIVLILIAFKTGEPPRWMWGFPKKNNNEDETL